MSILSTKLLCLEISRYQQCLPVLLTTYAYIHDVHFPFGDVVVEQNTRPNNLVTPKPSNGTRYLVANDKLAYLAPCYSISSLPAEEEALACDGAVGASISQQRNDRLVALGQRTLNWCLVVPTSLGIGIGARV
jgi:hypothetical protein